MKIILLVLIIFCGECFCQENCSNDIILEYFSGSGGSDITEYENKKIHIQRKVEFHSKDSTAILGKLTIPPNSLKVGDGNMSVPDDDFHDDLINGMYHLGEEYMSRIAAYIGLTGDLTESTNRLVAEALYGPLPEESSFLDNFTPEVKEEIAKFRLELLSLFNPNLIDVQNGVTLVANDLKQGYQVIVLAHSIGSFIANDTYEVLQISNQPDINLAKFGTVFFGGGNKIFKNPKFYEILFNKDKLVEYTFKDPSYDILETPPYHGDDFYHLLVDTYLDDGIFVKPSATSINKNSYIGSATEVAMHGIHDVWKQLEGCKEIILELNSLEISEGNFSFQATVEPEDTFVANFEWNFGDNSETVTTDLNTIEHTYSESGTYTVTVSALDPDGSILAKAETVVTVTATESYFSLGAYNPDFRDSQLFQVSLSGQLPIGSSLVNVTWIPSPLEYTRGSKDGAALIRLALGGQQRISAIISYRDANGILKSTGASNFVFANPSDICGGENGKYVNIEVFRSPASSVNLLDNVSFGYVNGFVSDSSSVDTDVLLDHGSFVCDGSSISGQSRLEMSEILRSKLVNTSVSQGVLYKVSFLGGGRISNSELTNITSDAFTNISNTIADSVEFNGKSGEGEIYSSTINNSTVSGIINDSIITDSYVRANVDSSEIIGSDIAASVVNQSVVTNSSIALDFQGSVINSTIVESGVSIRATDSEAGLFSANFNMVNAYSDESIALTGSYSNCTLNISCPP